MSMSVRASGDSVSLSAYGVEQKQYKKCLILCTHCDQNQTTQTQKSSCSATPLVLCSNSTNLNTETALQVEIGDKTMNGINTILLLFCHLLLLSQHSAFSPLCTDSRAPFTIKAPLVFCPHNGTVCCDPIEDSRLKKRFQAMNVSDLDCASLLKSILCAKCDPFSGELFKIGAKTRKVPLLCDTTLSPNLTKSKSSVSDFCTTVWDTCRNTSIWNSPFAPSLHGRVGSLVNPVSSKLTDNWQSKDAFCEAFGASVDNGTACFNGEEVSIRNSEIPQPPKGLCLEKIGNGSYLALVPHPDGSNRVFLANQQGKIWLTTVPEEGKREILVIDEANPFLDLTDQVRFDTELGLMGFAFHPNFVHNGRFFVSFNCDKVQWPECAGRCSCNTDVDCDPSKLEPQNGAMPCQYHSVIAEYTANGTTQPSLVTRANPSQVRRIFTMGLPYTGNHAGQILFGPGDGYLYFMMGDGTEGGDPYNFSQNKKSLLGKIMRFDIDKIPSSKEINNHSLWGNYSVPTDNPYIDDKKLLPEIWALGFRNPWRCSFDSERSSYFICGDSGQYEYEEIDMVKRGGNYGWRVYEGFTPYKPPKSPGGNTSASSINPIFPVMGYNHSVLDTNVGSASVTGGYFYRSKTDPCMYGRYLYMDLYAEAIWAGTEFPENSEIFTTSRLSFQCAHDSPMPCTMVAGSSIPSLGYIFSMGEDNRKDVFTLTSKGVYRVVRPSRCNYVCSKEIVKAGQPQTPRSSPSSSSRRLFIGLKDKLFLLLLCCLLLVFKLDFKL